MAYPTAIDSFVSPATTDYQNSPSHATQHTNANTAVAAIETKLGIGASAASGATDGQVLTADGAGNTAWENNLPPAGTSGDGYVLMSNGAGVSSFEKNCPVLTTDTDGATVTFDMNVSNLHTVTLGGNRTLAVSNVSVGQCFIIRLVQDGTGSRTVTWFTTIKWPDATTPTLTTTLNKTDVFGFVCTSAGNYDGYIVGQNL